MYHTQFFIKIWWLNFGRHILLNIIDHMIPRYELSLDELHYF